MSLKEFNQVLTEAVKDMALHGYDNEARLHEWLTRLRIAIHTTLPSEEKLDNQIESAMRAAFKRATSKNAITKYHPGVEKFTVDMLAPELRDELDKRILSSANLIKLNREQSIEKTLQRFSGWATSIPEGGSKAVDKTKIKQDIGKSLRQLNYEERRVHIDQGHKLISSINSVIAENSGAIAAIWHSKWRQPGYDFREDHKERDKKVYAIRNNWAMEQGLMKKGAGYTDEITQPGEEVFCRCNYEYITALRDLPEDMLTEKGKRVLAETRVRVA